jgi:hypothetical protein
MFKIDKTKRATTPVQKILTYGLIFFMAYTFFTESKREAEQTKLPTDKIIRVTNVVTGEVEEFNPNMKKISLSIKAGDIAALKAKPVNSAKDRIEVFSVEISTVKPAEVKKDAAPKAEAAKKEVQKKPVPETKTKTEAAKPVKTDAKEEKKPSENSNLDEKPVSN